MLTPAWIKQVAAEEAAEKLESEVERERISAASLRVVSKGPEFFQELLRELAITAEAVKTINAIGSISPLGNPEFESGCRISVRLRSVLPKQTYTDVLYQKGSKVIRCYTLEGEAFILSFCVCDDLQEIAVMSDEFPVPMNYKRVAQFIVQRMISRL